MTAALPLIGHDDQTRTFLTARESGRLHHGWILQGPSGIGKSRFAKRTAAMILGAAGPDASSDDPIMQKVLSGSHPDLKWIARENNEKGQLRQDITVGQIRDLNKFFSLRPAMAGWRVGVIDALDEANLSGLNALLKTLEEPPKNALLLLISHGTRTVLPTIRSRCHVLRFNRLSDSDTKRVLEGEGDAFTASLAHGRPGYALSLAGGRAPSAVQALKTLLKSIDRPNSAIVAQAIQAGAADEKSLNAFTDTILAWTAKQAQENPQLGKTWLALHAVRATAIELNLTPLQTTAKLISVLQDGLKSVAVPA